MTFADESIDIHVTQDVLEHVFNPSMAFREIKRTLRPGGIHLFTTPITETGDSTCCAALDADGKIVHLRPPEFHGNPISPEGCLVTWKWGRDLPHRIFESCGLLTSTYVTEAQEFGIKGEYIEVMVTWKR
jgi:SAM-dependent methyltransferase